MASPTTHDKSPHPGGQQVFSFTLELAGVDELTDEVADALFEAGCDDATLAMTGGRAFLDFDREADSISDAILSAVDAVEKCGLGIRVVEVAPPGRSTYDLVNAFLRLRDQFPNASLAELSKTLHPE